MHSSIRGHCCVGMDLLLGKNGKRRGRLFPYA